MSRRRGGVYTPEWRGTELGSSCISTARPSYFTKLNNCVTFVLWFKPVHRHLRDTPAGMSLQKCCNFYPISGPASHPYLLTLSSKLPWVLTGRLVRSRSSEMQDILLALCLEGHVWHVPYHRPPKFQSGRSLNLGRAQRPVSGSTCSCLSLVSESNQRDGCSAVDERSSEPCPDSAGPFPRHSDRGGERSRVLGPDSESVQHCKLRACHLPLFLLPGGC